MQRGQHKIDAINQQAYILYADLFRQEQKHNTNNKCLASSY